MLSVTSPAQNWWLWVESNHQPRAYETLALIRLSYTAMEARGGVEPRAFRPALEVRFRRPMPGTRAAIGGDGETRTHTMLFTRQPSCQLDHIASDLWSGREAD